MKLVPFIEYTKVDVNTSQQEIDQLCTETIQYGIQNICIPPYFVKQAAQKLESHNIHISAVIGFPYGYSTTFAKVEEIKRAIDDGANEVDVMLNIAAVKAANWSLVQRELDSVTTAARMKDCQIKLIISAGLLTTQELTRVLEICKSLHIDFVNTATAILNDTAPVDQVLNIVNTLNVGLKIKHTQSNITSLIDVHQLVERGVNRVTVFANNPIVKQLKN